MDKVRFTVVDCPQRTPEWTASRLGRLTSTGAADMLATIKSGEAAARRNLRTRLVLERLTGKSQEGGYVSAVMQAGIDAEDDALAAYEATMGTFLQRSGFLSCDDVLAGFSPDGHTEDFSGIVEAKSPLPATHLDYLRTGKVPTDYLRQCTHALWVTGAAWCDWFSYQPSFPDHLQMARVRIRREDLDLDDYDRKARAFLAEVEAEYRALLEMKGAVA